MSRYQYALKGFAAKLSSKQVERLKNDPRVDHISKNKMFHLAGSIRKNKKKINTHSNKFLSSQTTPWGVNRVGDPLDGTGKTAWILDTGIDLDHSDLNVDTQNSISYISGETADDNVGHGTYVAGILAAKDNFQDLVGVAAGAEVVSIKVCSQGGCPKSSILSGIDYVNNHASINDIINMSFGGPADTDIDDAVTDAANAGLRFVIAAGNNKADSDNYSPARVNHSNVWTVSAFRSGDEFAQDFDCGLDCPKGSNYGNPPINFSLPGENVPSLRFGGGSGMGFAGLGSEDGTSYAAPHLAGILLAAPSQLTTDGTVSNDPDGYPDFIAIAQTNLIVSISGPQFLGANELGTWTANVSNADGSVSYEWYYKKEDWSGYVFGGSSSTFSHAFNVSEPDQSSVKVEVSSAGETAYDVQSVEVNRCVGGIQPDSKTIIGINIKVPPCE